MAQPAGGRDRRQANAGDGGPVEPALGGEKAVPPGAEHRRESGRVFTGGILRERSTPAKVVRKRAVIDTALALTRDLADKPLVSLKLLKAHLTRSIKAELPAIIEPELAMHEVSFAQPEVRERIETLF